MGIVLKQILGMNMDVTAFFRTFIPCWKIHQHLCAALLIIGFPLYAIILSQKW